MKKLLIILFSISFIPAAHSQQSAEGDWMGVLQAGVELHIVFHIKKDAAGNLSGAMDSPDQGAKGIPVSSVMVEGDSLHVKMNMLKGGFDGQMINDTTIDGTWSQGPAQLPLIIYKTKNAITINRPQTPRPPYNYKSDDVEYDNADKSVHLAATLTYPATGRRFPAAILISGSGQQDRDETIFEHRPFAVIADYLTRRGFAVLRIDDRGMGKSTGDLAQATSADFAADVEASIAFLKKQDVVDSTHLGLIGHSEGGLIAALVASKRNDINFMVLLAGPGENGAVLLAEQNEAILKAGGIDSSIAASYKTFYLQKINAIIAAKDTATAYADAWNTFVQWQKTAPANAMTSLGFTSNDIAVKQTRAEIKLLSTPWMKYFLTSNAAKLLEKTNAKVLALNGEKDIQVIPAANLSGIANALKKSKSKVYETKMLTGLNHLFQRCTACTIMEYAKLEETFSPEALKIIGDWLGK